MVRHKVWEGKVRHKVMWGKVKICIILKLIQKKLLTINYLRKIIWVLKKFKNSPETSEKIFK